jgi:hypothetical protein
MDSDFSAPAQGAFDGIPDIIARMNTSMTAKAARSITILEGTK